MAFGIAGAQWRSVEIPRVPPKPLLMPLTANYRRTPVLQVGADVYCDSQNIARALGELGYEETLFPNQCHGASLAMASWSENVLFDLGVRVVITSVIDEAPADFIADRGSLYFDPGWTADGMKAALPSNILQLQANLAVADQALAATGYAVGTRPSYADAALGYIAWFVRGRWAGGAEMLEPFKNLIRLERELEEKGEGTPTDLSGEDALAIANAATPTSPTGVTAGYDNGLEQGQKVMVRPRGQTADPDVFGTLRYLDNTRVSIDHRSEETGDVAVHFPIAGYMVSAV